MLSQKRKVIFGEALRQGIQSEQKDAVILFEDRDRPDSYFTLNPELLSRHILLLGGVGTGKTNVFNLMMEQLRDDENDNTDDVFIVFDTKGDFYKNFAMPGDLVLGNGRLYRDGSARWNVFDDILADGPDPKDYELNAREVSAALFRDRGSQSQPFFSNAARDIFTYIMLYHIRRASESPETWGRHLNNGSLISFFRRADGEMYRKVLGAYPDLKGALSYIGDGTSNQALGVFGELRSMLNDCFLGVFAEDDSKGRFSMRKAVRQKGGRAVFIEYDLAVGETMTPIYRLLIDLALKEALGRSEGEKGNVYLVLDELKLLPKLAHLDDALNFGRGMGVKVIAGLQSINQLYEIYGREQALVISGAFSSVFAFFTPDNASREYVSELFGNNVTAYQFRGTNEELEYKEREGKTVESWDLMKLRLHKGEAVIGLANQDVPFLFQFQPFR